MIAHGVGLRSPKLFRFNAIASDLAGAEYSAVEITMPKLGHKYRVIMLYQLSVILILIEFDDDNTQSEVLYCD